MSEDLTRRNKEAARAEANIEKARRFLYDEDEPPAGNPANTPLPLPPVRKTPPRVNPIEASFRDTLGTCRRYSKQIGLVIAENRRVIVGEHRRVV